MPRKGYGGIMVSTALPGAEAWNMGVAERNRLNVRKLKYMRSMRRVTLMNRVRNKEMTRKTVVDCQIAD